MPKKALHKKMKPANPARKPQAPTLNPITSYMGDRK